MASLLPSIRAILTTTAARWQALADTLPAETLTRRPAPNEWSAAECLKHLLDAERNVFPARVQHFLKGEDFPVFNPDAQPVIPPDQLDSKAMAAELAARRATNLQLIDSLSEADFSRTARHSALGLVTLDQMIHEWAAHDLMHTVQAERALIQPFLPHVGAWRTYFADHDIEVNSK